MWFVNHIIYAGRNHFKDFRIYIHKYFIFWFVATGIWLAWYWVWCVFGVLAQVKWCCSNSFSFVLVQHVITLFWLCYDIGRGRIRSQCSLFPLSLNVQDVLSSYLTMCHVRQHTKARIIRSHVQFLSVLFGNLTHIPMLTDMK